jgi:transposase
MSLTDNGAPARPATAGVDWAKDTHAVCVVDADGEPIERVTIAHTKAGLARLVAILQRHQVSGVGIERPDGPVVDTMLGGRFTVYVIPPSEIKSLRKRYGSAGNKDDRFDAYVLADTVRTDRRRLTPLRRDTDPTTGLRQLCRARKDLIAHRIAVANQLRAHLAIALPAAVDLFTDIDSPISRKFLTRFPTQDQVDWLTAKRLATWLRTNHYSGRTDPTVLHQRITDAPYGAALPRAGTVRAARLLAEIGDARGRFPTATALACLAGVAPSTRQSGSVEVVSFRWAVDKQLRDAVCDFAGDSRNANPWAADLYAKARARGHDHPHAVRILGRAWIDIIWKCWTANQPYNPTRHRALQRVLSHPQPQTG